MGSASLHMMPSLTIPSDWSHASEPMSDKSNVVSIQAELARLRAENEALRKAQQSGTRPLKMKVSEKGAISIYGLNSKWPVTLYKGQMVRLIELVKSGTVEAFIKANEKSLAVKDVALAVEQASGF